MLFLYKIRIDGGDRTLVKASSCEEAGRMARARFPDARTLRLVLGPASEKLLSPGGLT